MALLFCMAAPHLGCPCTCCCEQRLHPPACGPVDKTCSVLVHEANKSAETEYSCTISTSEPVRRSLLRHFQLQGRTIDGIHFGGVELDEHSTCEQLGIADGAVFLATVGEALEFDRELWVTPGSFRLWWWPSPWAVKTILEPEQLQLDLGRPTIKADLGACHFWRDQGVNRELYVEAGRGNAEHVLECARRGGDPNTRLFTLLNPWDDSNAQPSVFGEPLSLSPFWPREHIDDDLFWNCAKTGMSCTPFEKMYYSSRSPLHEACKAGSAETVAQLLKLGANGFALAGESVDTLRTPAGEAIRYKAADWIGCVNLLTQYGYHEDAEHIVLTEEAINVLIQ